MINNIDFTGNNKPSADSGESNSQADQAAAFRSKRISAFIEYLKFKCKYYGLWFYAALINWK